MIDSLPDEHTGDRTDSSIYPIISASMCIRCEARVYHATIASASKVVCAYYEYIGVWRISISFISKFFPYSYTQWRIIFSNVPIHNSIKWPEMRCACGRSKTPKPGYKSHEKLLGYWIVQSGRTRMGLETDNFTPVGETTVGSLKFGSRKNGNNERQTRKNQYANYKAPKSCNTKRWLVAEFRSTLKFHSTLICHGESRRNLACCIILSHAIKC
jgi:hypothetical protein